MQKSIVVAAALGLAAVAWIASGQFGGGEHPPALPSAAAAQAVTDARPQVRVAHLVAEMRERHVVVAGRTEASRAIDLRAQIDGKVTEVLLAKGALVKEGDVILRLAVDERKARLDESQALLRQREIEFAAAKDLQQKGFRSDTNLAQAAAQLDAARSLVQQKQIELANTVIKAPFDGVLGHERAELGQYLRIGDKAANLVDLHPLLIVGYAAEREVAELVTGARGFARLVDGTMVEGTISYVAPQAEPATRTYRFELTTPNSDGRIRSGLTAEVAIPVANTPAHLLSPAVLSLADDGTLGVKTVEDGNRVAFHPVEIIGETADGLWVGGLPREVTLITVGQDFVIAGQEVLPVALPLPAAGGA